MFGRGFEAFGKPVPIRGAGPRLGSAPPPPAALEVEPVAPPARPQQQPQQPQRQMVAGRIPVYKKGDPGAPPCPVCR